MSEARDGGSVGEHYGRGGVLARILDALRAAGRDPGALTAGDLAPIDQLHARGREATLELARFAAISSGMRVLDVGGGLGGPARTLAGEFGCAVEVLDVTEEFCRAGEALTAASGLGGRVTFRHASALEMPYPDAGFDVAWTQHSSMNILHKERLYEEIQRVLRPGGLLALHEIMAGAVSPIHFPVMWARDPSLSHLRTPAKTRALLEERGFEELAWIDETAQALHWYQRRLAAMPAEPPPLGPHILFGDDFGEMLHNQVLNLSEDRISVVQALFERA
jgi:ubiquinone/menaquinone biosynthesis C-methylase UbiE